MGGSDDHIKLMIELCKDSDKAVVRGAALALSLAAYCEDNVDRMGRFPGCVQTLLDLCTKQEDQAVHAQALTAVANLAYSNPRNQVNGGYHCPAFETMKTSETGVLLSN